MRVAAYLVTVISLIGASAGSSHATGAAGLGPLPKHLPEKCASVASIPPSAEIPGPAIAAHVSVANCLAEHAMNGVEVAGDDASIAQLDKAVAPSVALLDQVIALGDPYWTMVAQNAKRDLYTSMVVRERVSLGGDLAAIDRLDPKLAAWQNESRLASLAIEDIAKQHPQVAKRDPVIAEVVQQNEQLARRVAQRPAGTPQAKR